MFDLNIDNFISNINVTCITIIIGKIINLLSFTILVVGINRPTKESQ